MVGFVSHRASLCTVRAVLEIMTTGRAHMLATFVRAAAWAAAIAGTLALVIPGVGAGVLEVMPHRLALLGGFAFGVGAAINGGCSLSTLQRLADGDLTMLAALAGFVGGVSALMWVDHQLALTYSCAKQSGITPAQWRTHSRIVLRRRHFDFRLDPTTEGDSPCQLV